MEPILTISDGTRTVDLLDTSTGFHLIGWEPTSPQMKDGGVFASSPFAPGRSLVSFQYDNLYETLTVSVDGDTQDDVIGSWNSLIELLGDALDYWASSRNNTPVYVTAKGLCETNTRFAVIKSVTFPTLINPYAPPFYPESGVVTTPDIPIVLELGIWTAYSPGNTVCVPLSQDATTFGTTGGCLGGVVLGNKHIEAQISHAYHFDASTVTFSANLIGAVKPVALLPAVPAAGDILYVGIDNVGTTGPFSSVIFDIGTAAVNITTMVYEYWNGAAWTAFTAGTYSYEINATFITNTGVLGFYFQQPYNMATTAINGVTAYWVRFRVTAVGGAPTPMTQANRDIYTAIMPYADNLSSDIPGTMDALARYILKSRSSGGPGTTFPVASEFLIGLRAKDRGLNFSAFINLGDSQNPAGINITVGANTSFVAGSTYANGVGAPTGILARYSPGAATEVYDKRLNIAVISPYADEWIGKYRVFLRYAVSTIGTGVGAFSIKLLYGFSQQQSKEVVTQTTGFQIAQLGTIDLMTDLDTGAIDLTRLDINLWVQHNVAVADILYLYDLILLPADEMLVQIIEAWSANNATDKSASVYDFYIDGATKPKVNAYADQRVETTNNVVDIWRVIAPDGIYAKRGRDTRMWLFQNYVPELVASPFLDIQPRYHIMRGLD